MSSCRPLLQIKGNKAQSIRQLIESKNRERIDSKADEIVKKDKHLLKRIEDYKKQSLKISELEKKRDDENQKRYDLRYEIEELLEKKHLRSEYGFYGIKYLESFKCSNTVCLVSDKTLDQLDKASKLYAFSRRKEANKIWDAIIEEYNLLE